MSFNIFSKAQLETFSDEQIELLNYTLFVEKVNDFNTNLGIIFKTLTFCQHDSEYRTSHTDEDDNSIQKAITNIKSFLTLNSTFTDKVYIYTNDYYKLTEYGYDWTNSYAGKSFFAVERKDFAIFVKNKKLDSDDYLLYRVPHTDDHVSFIKPCTQFEKHMNKLLNPVNNYKLPIYVDTSCPKTNDGRNYGTMFKELDNFVFIDMVKLVNDCN